MIVEEVGLLYQGLKDAATIVKTVDTAEAKLDLYAKLLDLSSKSLNLQVKMQEMLDENRNLKQQIEELQKVKITEDDIEHYEHPYITLKSDKEKLRKFCANCWAEHRILFQLDVYRPDMAHCQHCQGYVKIK